jgi:hypothetical protein
LTAVVITVPARRVIIHSQLNIPPTATNEWNQLLPKQLPITKHVLPELEFFSTGKETSLFTCLQNISEVHPTNVMRSGSSIAIGTITREWHHSVP